MWKHIFFISVPRSVELCNNFCNIIEGAVRISGRSAPLKIAGDIRLVDFRSIAGVSNATYMFLLFSVDHTVKVIRRLFYFLYSDISLQVDKNIWLKRRKKIWSFCFVVPKTFEKYCQILAWWIQRICSNVFFRREKRKKKYRKNKETKETAEKKQL